MALVATPFNSPTCSATGMTLNGGNQYTQITSWSWGGAASFEVVAEFLSFQGYSRVFDFGSGGVTDFVIISNVGTTNGADAACKNNVTISFCFHVELNCFAL
jgi:hypothetical protein